MGLAQARIHARTVVASRDARRDRTGGLGGWGAGGLKAAQRGPVVISGGWGGGRGHGVDPASGGDAEFPDGEGNVRGGPTATTGD